jgi:DNA-directed RNA polymerase specialized sigma24 family protein
MGEQTGVTDDRLAAYYAATERYRAAELAVTAAADARALSVLELCDGGLTRRQVAAMLGMTAAMVQKLVVRARRVVAADPAASLENSRVGVPVGDAALF